MVWTYLFTLPAVVSFFWPLMIIFCKRQVFTAQWIMVATQILTGFTIFFYMGEIAARYIYNCIFVTFASLCVPMYYMFVCSLTSREGISRKHRWSFIPSFLFLIIYYILILALGPERYQMYMDSVVAEGNTDLLPSKAYSLMVFVGYYGFPVFMMLLSLILFSIGLVRIHRYHSMLAYVAGDNISKVRRLDRPMVIFTYTAILIALVFVIVPQHILSASPFIVIPLSIIASLIQFILGFYAFRLSGSAEHLRLNQPHTVAENKEIQ